MPRYVTLASWTDQGIHDVRETLSRAEQVRTMARELGGDMHTLYWTQGRYDLIAVTDAPDDATVAAVALRIGMSGNVRTEVLRAFDAEEMGQIITKLG
ncbi:MAG: GYD domain-containing protein [Chloroflexota bacterium]|nr:GYD domain-containing protein [Chloroflexota bacterium]